MFDELLTTLQPELSTQEIEELKKSLSGLKEPLEPSATKRIDIPFSRLPKNSNYFGEIFGGFSGVQDVRPIDNHTRMETNRTGIDNIFISFTYDISNPNTRTLKRMEALAFGQQALTDFRADSHVV